MKLSIELVHSQWLPLDAASPLLKALAELSPQAQRAINLRFWENYTIEEISSDLRISWNAADQLIDQSINELRKRLLKSRASLQMIKAS